MAIKAEPGPDIVFSKELRSSTWGQWGRLRDITLGTPKQRGLTRLLSCIMLFFFHCSPRNPSFFLVFGFTRQCTSLKGHTTSLKLTSFCRAISPA